MWQQFKAFVNFWRYNTHPARMEAKSRKLVLFGCNKALAVFRDAKLRQLLKFNQISEEEQNRIFNELTVTNLILLMLILDQLTREELKLERKEYLIALRQAIPNYFNGFIDRLNIPKELTKIWHKLVDLRYDQYCHDLVDWRGAILNDEKLAEFGSDNRLMIFQTIVFGLYCHLTRSSIREPNPLYQFLQVYVLVVYQWFLKKI